ncbi:hypothetical protein HDR58_10835 [bacterium]|nr:hypothetical protein [bacterium]
MLPAISNINLYNKNTIVKNNNKVNYIPSRHTPVADSVNFTGKSLASKYSTVFEYLAAELFGGNKKYGVDGSLLSSKNIGIAVKQVFDENKAFPDFKRVLVEKIKWKSYIPKDVRTFSIDKINQARAVRLSEWKEFLTEPEKAPLMVTRNPKLVAKVKKDKALRVVIWDAITSEIKDNNRHIPVPFNETALFETITDYEKIEPKARAVRCSKPSFLEIYTHRLRDNLLMEMDLSEKESVWVKVPSIKHAPFDREKNVSMLETLSCRNWCTRSSVDKAQAALEDGDFYIFLHRSKSHKLWEPLIGMTTLRGKIDQIQGVENNNIVPLNLLGEIKSFLNSRNLKCHSGVIDEGPKAHQAILISEKLSEVNNVTKKNFLKAIKENDDLGMFKFLGVDTKQLESGLLEIGTYKPVYNFSAEQGISVPYSMFGLNEDVLLRNVEVINGNLVLQNKNSLFNSLITEFPPNLRTVTGKVICSESQYERFGDDINRVVNNNMNRVIIRR